jgi:hypothetical protein
LAADAVGSGISRTAVTQTKKPKNLTRVIAHARYHTDSCSFGCEVRVLIKICVEQPTRGGYDCTSSLTLEVLGVY